MNLIESIGIIAAVLTTIAWMPQTLKTLRTKSTKDLSLRMLLIMNIGILLWFIHGMAVVSVPLIVANSITFPFSATVLLYKIKHK